MSLNTLMFYSRVTMARGNKNLVHNFINHFNFNNNN